MVDLAWCDTHYIGLGVGQVLSFPISCLLSSFLSNLRHTQIASTASAEQMAR